MAEGCHFGQDLLGRDVARWGDLAAALSLIPHSHSGWAIARAILIVPRG